MAETPRRGHRHTSSEVRELAVVRLLALRRKASCQHGLEATLQQETPSLVAAHPQAAEARPPALTAVTATPEASGTLDACTDNEEP